MSDWHEPLRRLLAAAEIPGFYAGLWFQGCTFVKGSVILVPDTQTAECLERLFGAKLRSVVPSLQFLVNTPTLTVKNPTPRQPDLRRVVKREHWTAMELDESDLLGRK